MRQLVEKKGSTQAPETGRGPVTRLLDIEAVTTSPAARDLSATTKTADGRSSRAVGNCQSVSGLSMRMDD